MGLQDAAMQQAASVAAMAQDDFDAFTLRQVSRAVKGQNVRVQAQGNGVGAGCDHLQSFQLYGDFAMMCSSCPWGLSRWSVPVGASVSNLGDGGDLSTIPIDDDPHSRVGHFAFDFRFVNRSW